MASPDQSLRVDRNQAALIFWGMISLCFATGACYYFWKNTENERKANHLRDEVVNLQSMCDTLEGEKKRLQSGNAETADQIKERESLLQQKETQLSGEEARLAALNQKPPAPSPPPQIDAIKKFADALPTFAHPGDSEIVTRGSSQVLRVNGSLFFDPGESVLQSEGKALLIQIAQFLKGQSTGVELRIESFTDGDAETKASAQTDSKAHSSTPWILTSARCASLNRFFHDQALLPPSMLLILARGDSQPVATTGNDARTRNRRIEISLTPAPDNSSDIQALPPDAPAPTGAGK